MRQRIRIRGGQIIITVPVTVPVTVRVPLKVLPKAQARAIDSLTSREKQVLDFIIKGRVNKEIASELHLSVHAVKFHVSNLLGKFGVVNRHELILLGVSEWQVKERP